jgi:catalase
MSDERPVTTTDAGIPAASDEFSLTAGPSGPTVLHDHYVVQKMQHFNRERVPERVVHAKGSGAHGFFEVTEDVTGWTKASFLAAVGQRTPVFARFSTVAGELGSPDTWRDPRGFAVKLYTEEGNFDLVATTPGSQPTYAPNSYGGPQADPDRAADLGWWVEAAEIGRYAYDKHAEDDDFV